jgi:hypothetical protein
MIPLYFFFSRFSLATALNFLVYRNCDQCLLPAVSSSYDLDLHGPGPVGVMVDAGSKITSTRGEASTSLPTLHDGKAWLLINLAESNKKRKGSFGMLACVQKRFAIG